MICDRYPERVVLEPSAVLADAPEGIRASLGEGCDHGHNSSFEGSTFFCGGTLSAGNLGEQA